MTVQKSSPLASSRITCFGTAFLIEAPIDAKPLIRAIPAEAPQFASPRMDASFLINCGRLLSGKPATTETPGTYVKRIAGRDFRSPKGTVGYECSIELRDLLAALTPERAAEIATHCTANSADQTPMAAPSYAWQSLRISPPSRDRREIGGRCLCCAWTIAIELRRRFLDSIDYTCNHQSKTTDVIADSERQ